MLDSAIKKIYIITTIHGKGAIYFINPHDTSIEFKDASYKTLLPQLGN